MPGHSVFRRAIPALLSGLAALMGGCATPVLQSGVDVPTQFAAAPVSATDPEVTWWEGFGDPVLSDLIQRAALENRDVKIAAERVRAARAGETISRSSLLPSFGANAFGLNHDSDGGPDLNAGSAALSVSWEIDVAGGLRAGASAATYDRIATEDGARAVRLLVL